MPCKKHHLKLYLLPGTKITKKPLNQLNFPSLSKIAGVIRDGNPIIPFGDFQLQENDQTIVFSLTESIKKIEEFFQ